MLKELTQTQKKWVEDTLSSMTEMEKICQMVCEIYSNISASGDVDAWLKKYPVGTVYVGSEVIDKENKSYRQLKEEVSIVNAKTKIPLILCSDFEQGVGGQLDNDPFTCFPDSMAIAAAGNAQYAYEAGRINALESGVLGVHWTFSTVTDLAMGKDNPITLTRSFGSDPDKMIPFIRSHIRGLQEHGCAATGKHFPGDGVDNRNQHFVTSFNPLKKEEWMATYGKVWKAAIDEGLMTIMVGHIAMPELEKMDEKTHKYRPATASKLLMTDLLRGELGYKGLIVSDALGMNGFCSWADYETRLIDAFNGGVDVFLWPETERFVPMMMQALADGKITSERLDDAVRHVLELKARLDLKLGVVPFDGNGKKISSEIAANALNLLRNEKNTLPLEKKKDAKYLVMVTPSNERAKTVMTPFAEALKEYGNVEYCLFKEMDEEKLGEYDAVMLLNVARARYGDSRGWEAQIWPFLKREECKKRIVIGFANPFFYYDVPSCDAYINAYNNYAITQKLVMDALFGKGDFPGKSPIEIPGYVKVGDGLTLK